MYYSPILVLVLITILSLSGAYSERYPRDYRKSNYESPLNDEPQDEVLDIGNGNYRKNVIVMEPGNSQPNPLGNRFNADPTRQRTYTTNIGNGNHNHNIIDFGASAPETSDPNGENSGGTSFVHNGNNGLDVFHVGYGKNNQNHITVDGRPIKPNCHGSTCEDVKVYLSKNGAAKTNQAFSLLLSSLSIFYLVLI
ncbi:uncharacterized protein LOC123866399 isoform X2 [Maniola jurtina]|uniref:uncharacterized protein LOC123866399 isoform X2 n=1 Tax=Maniola jurtina TaxID=191418 RepID=UPI001E68A6FE|nr:uncharacterized protein LOC123866399 isoform X2 [Maniola jurtina]